MFFLNLSINKFPSGLAVHDSDFLGPDDSTGVFVGPHPQFSKAERDYRDDHSGHQVYFQQPMDVFNHETMIYRSQFQRHFDAPLLECSNEQVINNLCMNSSNSEICVCKCKVLKGLKLLILGPKAESPPGRSELPIVQ